VSARYPLAKGVGLRSADLLLGRHRLGPRGSRPREGVKTDMLALQQAGHRTMNNPLPIAFSGLALVGASLATTLGEHVDGVIRVVTLGTLLGTLVAYRRNQRRPGLDPLPIITRWSAVGLIIGLVIEAISALS
jgi:hypothetical protein